MKKQTPVTPNISWPLLPVPDEHGYLSFPNLEQSIQQSIKIILKTRPNERLMRPLFGAGLEDMVHEQNTLTTRREIQDLVADSLSQWEPRIELEQVDVQEDLQKPGTVRVEILYRIIRTDKIQQLGVTMELES